MKFRLTETGRKMTYRDSLTEMLKKHELLIDDSISSRKDAVYARVSTHKQKSRGDLDRQIEKVCAFAALRNPKNLTVYSDTASGLNDNRKGLNILMDEVMQGSIDRIFVNYMLRIILNFNSASYLFVRFKGKSERILSTENNLFRG